MQKAFCITFNLFLAIIYMKSLLFSGRLINIGFTVFSCIPDIVSFQRNTEYETAKI